MSKTDRYFEIIQILRQASRPIFAQELAEALEVSRRTIYRDMAVLQARQIPIYGEAGVGYVLKDGYDLPPINFDLEEAEAVSLGLNLIARTGDPTLWKAARRAARKLHEIAPNEAFFGPRLSVASTWGVEPIQHIDTKVLRRAIRDEAKIEIQYVDGKGRESNRVIWPLIIIYFVESAVLVCWCELRSALRNFRLDRISSYNIQAETFSGHSADLVKAWRAAVKEEHIGLGGIEH